MSIACPWGLAALSVLACLSATGNQTNFEYRIVRSFPHDQDASTQGLVMHRGQLFESTGGYGTSSVRRVDLRSGRVLRVSRLPDELFGEGLAAVGSALYQLTWRAGIGLIRDAETLARTGEFAYAGEGWGLAWDGAQFIMSDGTGFLRFLDRDLQQTRRVEVTDRGVQLIGLNELEFVDGHVVANVWDTTRIAFIDPESGQVRGWLDLADILPTPFRTSDVGVLNGIAYDADKGQLLVTGKLWPRLFAIELIPPIAELEN